MVKKLVTDNVENVFYTGAAGNCNICIYRLKIYSVHLHF